MSPGPADRRSIAGSFRAAWEGLVTTAARQRNMKAHVVSGVLVGLVGSGITLGLAEKVTLILCVILVLFAETLNSSLEALVDLHTEDFRNLARATKDAAAAGVLVLSLGTVVIFAALLVHNWPTIAASGPRIARQVAYGVPLAVAAGLLLWSRPRPALVDHLLFAAGVLLLVRLATFTASAVFTAMTAGLFALARLAAARRGTQGDQPRAASSST